MLHKRLTSNSLFHDDEEAKKDRQQIYVRLALVERKKPDKREGGFSPEQGTKLYEPQYEEKQRFEHDAFLGKILAQGEGKTQGKQIALIGEPGAGKTTLLQEIADWVLEQKLGLPVWISMADLARQTGTLSDFWEYLQETWLGRAVTEPKGVRQNFKEQFEQGRVWLLLDGVDEVATSGGKTLQAIANQLKGWLGNARVVLTCRLNVWQGEVNALSEFETYRLLDFDYPQQVHQFIDKWFAPSPGKSLEGKGERLKAELDKAELRIRDLVQNPLRLALLCGTWQLYEGNLPETKAGLYGQFVQQFYRWKSERFSISKQKQEELNQALESLAFNDVDSSGGRFRLRESLISEKLGDPKDNNSLCRLALDVGWLNHVGVAAESPEKQVYAFFHPTFEEYFAARAIDNWDDLLPREHKNKPVKGKQYRIFEPQWKQVILLWLGREDVDREQKEQFMKALIELDDGCGNFSGMKRLGRGFYEYQAYLIAAAGIKEFRNFSKAEEIVKQLANWGCGNFLIKEEAIATLLETDSSKAIPALAQQLQSSQNLITSWQAAGILGEIGRGNKEAIAALAQLLKSSQNQYIRMQAAESLGKIDPGNQEAIAALVQQLQSSQDEETRRRAADSLGEIGRGNWEVNAALVQLIQSSENEETRRRAAGILGEIGTGNREAIGALVQLLPSNQDKETRRQAADSLGKIGRNNQIRSFVQLVPSIDVPNTYILATVSLGEIGRINREAIAALVKLIQSTQDEKTRRQAVYSLEEIGRSNQEAIAALVQLLQSTQYEDTNLNAVVEVSEIGSASLTIANLVQQFQSSQDEETSRRAAKKLGEIGRRSSSAIANLVQQFQSSQDEETRREAADILGFIGTGTSEAIADLVQQLQLSQDEETRREAAESLGFIGTGTSEEIAALVQLLQSSQDQDIRRRAVVSLGEIIQDNQKAEVVTALKQCLSAKGYKNNPHRFEKCYELIWSCAQTLPYPEFYQAWHKSELLSWHKSELLYLVRQVFQR